MNATRTRGSLPLALALASACALGPRSLRAAPGQTLGFGSRALSLGGATSADSPDGSAVFYNPSGLVLATRSELALSYSATDFALDTNGQPGNVPALHALSGSLLGRGDVLGLPVAFGLALSLSNAHLSRVRTVTAAEPRWVLDDGLPELFNLGADLALRPLSWLSLGGGIGFLAATQGGFDVRGTALLADGQGAEYDSQLSHSVDANLESERYPSFGLTATPLDNWAFSLVYRGEARLDQRITGTLAGTIDAGLLTLPVRYEFESQKRDRVSTARGRARSQRSRCAHTPERRFVMARVVALPEPRRALGEPPHCVCAGRSRPRAAR